MDISHLVFNESFYKNKGAVQQFFAGLEKELFNPVIFQSNFNNQSINGVKSFLMKSLFQDKQDSSINEYLSFNEFASMMLMKSSENTFIVHIPVKLIGGAYKSKELMITFFATLPKQDGESFVFNLSELIKSVKKYLNNYCNNNESFMRAYRTIGIRHHQMIGLFYYNFKRSLNVRYEQETSDLNQTSKSLILLKDEIERILLMINATMLLMIPGKEISNDPYEERKRLLRKEKEERMLKENYNQSIVRRKNTITAYTFEHELPEIMIDNSVVDLNYKITDSDNYMSLLHISVSCIEHGPDEELKSFDNIDHGNSIEYKFEDMRMMELD